MKAGSIFFDTDFGFHDGESGEKLFVVLGSHQGAALVAKTTSQVYGRGIQFGCQPNDRFYNFHLPVNSCYLKKNTWICLDEFYELKFDKLLGKKFTGKVRHICDLPDNIAKLVQHCAMGSQDISGLQKSIIFSSLIP